MRTDTLHYKPKKSLLTLNLLTRVMKWSWTSSTKRLTRLQDKPHEQSHVLVDLSGPIMEPDGTNTRPDLRQRKTCLASEIVLSVTVVVFDCDTQKCQLRNTQWELELLVPNWKPFVCIYFCSITCCVQRNPRDSDLKDKTTTCESCPWLDKQET